MSNTGVIYFNIFGNNIKLEFDTGIVFHGYTKNNKYYVVIAKIHNETEDVLLHIQGMLSINGKYFYEELKNNFIKAINQREDGDDIYKVLKFMDNYNFIWLGCIPPFIQLRAFLDKIEDKE